ncbi:hypothetical protein [Sangeribacter muris]|jgi:hypothetical protein|uniref:hypothetical protein n=1 Tax=Sangeribacter muris TaxID=2880703 RepID=UPI000FFE54B2|nr:hypothetical protein [Sangeribacter muris]RXE69888.1 hypothetical protein ED328_00465 [Muribaculaceae bacterium Isolate-001 (NCI)]
MQSIQLNIIGQSIQLVKRSADELRGLNMGEKLSLDFYNGNFRDTDLLFVKPKGANPTPRKCAIVSERLSQLFGLPVVFILAPAMTYERQRLMEKGVYFVMSEKYANLPMLVAMEKVSSRKIPSHLTPVAQYLLLYHLQVESIEGKSTKTIASLMPYSYESVSLGLTCLSDLGLCVKVALDSRSRAVSFKSRGKELWEAAEKYVVNPVERRVYCDALNSERKFPVCGINALAHYTALNPDAERWVMVTGKDFKDMDADGSVLNPNEFDGNIIIEIWKYPRVCRKHDSEMYVDRLSLALSLRHDEDPRVEEEVEQLIKQVKWSD